MLSKNFTKSEIDMCLYELAKVLKKQNRTISNIGIEIVLVGGASVLLNYNFRDSTTDIDAIMTAKQSVLDAAKVVSEKLDLPDDWINADFIKTPSYSPKLVEHSKYYKTFCGFLNVRTIEGEYLFAMKLKSFRTYKKDKSDLIGIAKERIELGKPLNFNMICKAIDALYGEDSHKNLPKGALDMAQEILTCNNLEELYYSTLLQEKKNKNALLLAEKEYPGKINEENVDSFLKHFATEFSTDERE